MIAPRVLQARYLLWPLRNSLYGKENVFFDLESHYVEHDGMLMRNMFYAHFGVHEVAFEARLRFTDRGEAVFSVFGYPESISVLGGMPSLGELARSRLAKNGEQAAVDSKPMTLDIAFSMRHTPYKASLRISYRSDLRKWCESLLEEWARSNSEFILTHSKADILLDPVDTWILSRRISEVDTDLSGESPPQVYRWKEVLQSNSSFYADLDESTLASILQAAGIALPPDSHRTAKLREDSSSGNSFLLLRFKHLIPDPQGEPFPGPIQEAEHAPIWENKGFIRLEGDFLEFLIDARNRKVVSEYRKWRSAGSGIEGPPTLPTSSAALD
jgi:hypothetical protein